MANEAFKAADLIGKVIIVGNNQGTITVKGVQDNGMLACEFSKAGEDATTPMTVTMPNLQKMQERGLWRIQSEEFLDEPSGKAERRVKSEEFAAATPTSDVSPQTSEVTTEADVQEVQDIVPVVTPKAKSDGGSMKSEEKPQPIPADAPTRSLSDIKPQTSNQPKPKPKDKTNTNPTNQTNKGGKYAYSTYQTSKGKTGAKITGVSETDAAYQQAAAIHASGSYERDNDGNKHYYLCFGPRYVEAAKKVCELLNAGNPIEDAIAVVNAATEERAAKREEARAKREERKTQPSNISPQTSTAKTYTAAEVVDLIQRLAKKDPKALAEYEAMLQAA